MRFFAFAFAGVLSLCACSAGSDAGGGGTDGGVSGVDATSDATPPDDGAAASDTGAATSDSGASDTGSSGADAGPAIPFCTQTCTTASDCATASAAFGADNYACASGVCEYLGCNSDAECKSSFANSAYACRKLAGATVSTCVHTCTKPADCAAASAAYDADNYACEGGLCNYLGCNTDAECKSSFASSAYVCRAVDATAAKSCVKSCTKASDCATASAAYDADNYACEGGLCRYSGCNSDAECKSSFMKPNYACR